MFYLYKTLYCFFLHNTEIFAPQRELITCVLHQFFFFFLKGSNTHNFFLFNFSLNLSPSCKKGAHTHTQHVRSHNTSHDKVVAQFFSFPVKVRRWRFSGTAVITESKHGAPSGSMGGYLWSSSDEPTGSEDQGRGVGEVERGSGLRV